MKKNLFFVCMMVAMMAASVGLSGCSKSDSDNVIPGEYVGTWTCDEYCPSDNMNLEVAMYDEDGWPPTTVTINGDGSCSGSGLVINGNGTCSIKTGNKWEDGYWAIITFYQNGKMVSTATVKTYTNDHRTGYVALQGYTDKLFIFTK